MANDRDVTLILIYILFFSKNCKKAKRKLFYKIIRFRNQKKYFSLLFKFTNLQIFLI